MFFCLLVYLHICLETEEIEQKIRLLQLELEDALEVAEVSKTESGKYIPRLGQEAIHKQKP